MNKLSKFSPFSQDDIRLEAKRQLYKSVSEDKDGNQKFKTPSFSSTISYIIDRVANLPKSKWIEVANNYVPFSVPVLEQVSASRIIIHQCYLKYF